MMPQAFLRGLGCLLLAAGAVCAWGQQAAAPGDTATLPVTVTWLRNTIAKSGGFSYAKTTTTADTRVGPVQNRLGYVIHEVKPCHIGWGENISGDEEMKMMHPENGLDEDFGVVEPRSAAVVPVDLAAQEGAGTNDLGGGGSIKIAVAAGASEYWKVTGRWAFVHNDGIDEPFGFVFGDEQLAEQVALVLDHAIDLCSGPRNLVGEGCRGYGDQMERYEFQGVGATYINHSEHALTCVTREWVAPHMNDPIDMKYFNMHALEMGIPMEYTVKPGEKYAPADDGPRAPRVLGGMRSENYDVRIEQLCYREHSVDNVGNECVALHLRGDQ